MGGSTAEMDTYLMSKEISRATNCSVRAQL